MVKQIKHLDDMETTAQKWGGSQLNMHLSALSPTTRKTHAQRHGKLFTAQQIRDFWADPSNVEGYKCSITAVLVDDQGTPLVRAIVERARKNYEVMAAKGYDWSK